MNLKFLILSLIFQFGDFKAPPMPSIGLNVVEKPINDPNDFSLSTIFTNFITIASNQPNSTFDNNVAIFETSVQTMEISLMNHHSNILSLVNVMIDKMQAVQNADNSGAFKSFFDNFQKFSTSISTLNDFNNGTNNAGQSQSNITARVEMMKIKIGSYQQIQLIAAKNVSKINFYLATLSNLLNQNSDLMSDQNFRISILTFRDSLVALKNEVYQYAADLGIAANKILTLQYDVQFNNDGCVSRPPCGTFKSYDPTVDVKAPKRDGFYAGKYWNTFEVYVGLGNSRDNRMTPGRLMVSYPGPGVFMEAYYEIVDKSPKTMKYLLNHPQLRWVNHTWIKNGQYPAGAIMVNNPDISFAIGKYTINGITQIGKIMGGGGFYFGDNGTSYSVQTFQILVC
ncbi:hypothetical protein PVAND_016976 [Polypedilum vanderplanki]|uniref:Uncharacterized protein n=1 Tax=Polypedilum vanderplanki TaxID=319348 RepID=A0A9J6BGY8_POLVA|nr:hypothetical protein PVAND_016976 [Polypedilum vanderplanki]